MLLYIYDEYTRNEAKPHNLVGTLFIEHETPRVGETITICNELPGYFLSTNRFKVESVNRVFKDGKLTYVEVYTRPVK